MPLVQRPGDDWLGLGPLPGVKILNDAVELARREVFVEVVIHLHRRRAGAGADAFDFFERKNPVRGRFLVADYQPFLRAVQKFISTLQHTRHVRANLHVVLAHRLPAQHRVVRQSLFNLHVIKVQALPDFRDHLVADAAIFILRIHQHGNQRAALHRITVLQQFESRRKLRGKLHDYLSTSPRTMSMVPMHAMTSAINCPSINFGSACRLIYEGDRKCARSGFGEPSLAMKHPSSPRGDSTLTYASPGAGENPSVKILKW